MFSFQELSLENLGQWPFLLRLIMIAAIAVFVLGFGFFYSVRMSVAQLKTVKEIFEKRLNHFIDIQKKIKFMAEMKREVKDLEGQFDALAKALPEEEDEAKLLEEISEVAVAESLRFESIKPKMDKALRQDIHQQKEFEFILTGSFKGFGNFINKISHLQRLVTFEDCIIQSQKISKGVAIKKEPLKMQVQAKIHWVDWRYAKESEANLLKLADSHSLKQALNIKPIPVMLTLKRDPFLPFHLSLIQEEKLQLENFEPSRSREPLEAFPLDSLKMVGAFKLGNKNYALIKDTTGFINRVTVGNYLGKHSGKIEKLTDHAIEIQEWFADGKGSFQTEKTRLSLSNANVN